MKQAVLNDTIGILHKIETIEEEILDLKFAILKNLAPSQKGVISLKGILKGIEVTESEIEDAGNSLYGRIKI